MLWLPGPKAKGPSVALGATLGATAGSEAFWVLGWSSRGGEPWGSPWAPAAQLFTASGCGGAAANLGEGQDPTAWALWPLLLGSAWVEARREGLGQAAFPRVARLLFLARDAPHAREPKPKPKQTNKQKGETKKKDCRSFGSLRQLGWGPRAGRLGWRLLSVTPELGDLTRVPKALSFLRQCFCSGDPSQDGASGSPFVAGGD